MPRILGIDYGDTRMGVAVSDPAAILAVALRTVPVNSDADACLKTLECCRETEAERIVVGIPISLNGTRGPMAQKVQRFVDRLAGAAGIPVETWDERMTTSMVERGLIAADVSRAKRKGLRDKLAAQAILQSYLDAKCSATE